MLLDGSYVVLLEGSTTVLLFHIFNSLLNGKIQIVLMEVLHYESACACESEKDPEPYRFDRDVFVGGNWNLRKYRLVEIDGDEPKSSLSGLKRVYKGSLFYSS